MAFAAQIPWTGHHGNDGRESMPPAVSEIQSSRVTRAVSGRAAEQSSRQFLRRLPVETGEKILLLRTGDIEWLQSTGNLVRVHMGAQYHVIRQSLTKLHELLDPARFLRVHRNAIVNLDQVDEFHLPTLGNMFVKLRSGFCLPLRKSSRALLRRNLITTPQRLAE